MARSSARSTAVAVRKRPAKSKERRRLTSGYEIPKNSALGLTAASARASSLYSVHPGVAMMQRWIAELKARTGCSLDQWIKHIQLMGPKDEGECREWLKERHKLGMNTAWR